MTTDPTPIPTEQRLPLVLVPPSSDVLWRVCDPVTNPVTQIYPRFAEMVALLKGGPVKAAGLAAPQVGIPLRFFITISPRFPLVVNPVILESSKVQETDVEGCVSWGVPVRYTKVTRSRWIRVRFLDGQMKPIEHKLFHFEARVFMHEADHLDGKNIFPR